VLAATGLIAFVAVLVLVLASGSLAPFSSRDPDSGSEHARALLARATGADPDFSVVALVELPAGFDASASTARLAAVARVLRIAPQSAGILLPVRGGPLVSRDQHAALVIMLLRTGSLQSHLDAARRIEARFAGERDVLVGGQAAFYANGNRVAEHDLLRTDVIAFVLLVPLCFLFFRSAVAALFVTLVGGLTVLLTFAALALLAHATEISAYTRNVVSGLGLGLGVDYSLLLVTRLREEAGQHGYGQRALERTLDTAGRTITVSAVIVAGAGASLLAFPEPLLRSIGVAVILVALSARLVAGGPLVALLALLGSRVNALTLPRWRERRAPADLRAAPGWLRRHVQRVQGRPWPYALAVGGLLVVLAAPAFGIRFTQVDPNVVPKSSPDRQVARVIARSFPTPNALSPVYVAVRAPATAGPLLQAFARSLRSLPGAAAVSRPARVGPDTWRIDVIPAGPPLDDRAERLVRSVRAAASPYPALVGGQSAQLVDLRAGIDRGLPWALVILLACTLGPLAWATRSALLPAKTFLLNALTLAAAFGVLVFVFQDGRLQGFLGYTSSGALEASTMAAITAIAFALATDYGVFLLTRITQERKAGLDDNQAVARALERTGPVITKAALLLCVALGSLVFARHALVKEVGVGTAVAVILDAWLVRLFLVPALMRLLGPRWNWWPGRHAR
jgi:uncharacterized membrane protein YdfJ with MMPL/SSD domain